MSVAPIASLRSSGGQPGSQLLLLSLLTATVCICWTPRGIFVCSIPFMNQGDKFNNEILTYLITLSNLQAIMDPIIFTLAVKDLRENVRKTFIRK